MTKHLLEKLKESVQAVLPIGIIILILHFTVAPMPMGTLALMLSGMLMLIIGLTLFSLGTDMAMMPMGEHIGSALIRQRNMPLLVIVLLVFGFVVTAAEPDLTVLANQVASIPNTQLIFGISAGVGVFLVLATLRILFRWKLSNLLLLLYAIAFGMAAFSSEYLAVAVDASAVTTGPITVPFLLAIGAGFAAVSSGPEGDEANFGIIAICSIGPILAVLLLGLFFDPSNNSYITEAEATVGNAAELLSRFGGSIVHTMKEVLFVLLPIVVIFLIFQVIRLRLSQSELIRIGIGLLYLLTGLTIFLSGVNTGFMPAAKSLGETMGLLSYNWILIPICVVVGACVVIAEPAVHVLTKQVEEITSGAITRSMMLFGMALGVGIAMSLAMVRMLFGISIWWIMLPGYIIALTLSRFVPNIFVGVGFDSGGVAAGAMSAAFVLPFTIGVCTSLGGNVIMEAFGVVGMIAMIPPITIQIMGVIYQAKLRRAEKIEKQLEQEDAEATEGDLAPWEEEETFRQRHRRQIREKFQGKWPPGGRSQSDEVIEEEQQDDPDG
ncbi:DUF1538 domain-containing protein [Ruminococcaceae bacterium OttesenSCG-928-I18]|nr:DUF1538 domain-containing protein [Ruminococcaceae bacterium OttesenSCG-928-I18]